MKRHCKYDGSPHVILLNIGNGPMARIDFLKLQSECFYIGKKEEGRTLQVSNYSISVGRHYFRLNYFDCIAKGTRTQHTQSLFQLANTPHKWFRDVVMVPALRTQ
jgi:hypothetical protein